MNTVGNYFTDENENLEENPSIMINLSYQSLSKIPSNSLTLDPSKITQIDLSHNNFNNLPLIILEFMNLQSLDLSNNNLTSIPYEIQQLKNLKTFAARNNKISTLPDGFTELSNLENLNLSGNEFSTFPPQILALQNLKTLYFGANRISILPENINGLIDLEILYLGGNQLQWIPDTVSELANLTSLSLADNQLQTLPSLFENLSKLRSLSLHNNQIQILPPEIATLPNLSALSLRNNPLITQFANNAELFKPPTLKELAARIIRKTFEDEKLYENQLPKIIFKYLQSASTCVNPKCKGVYFEAKSEHVKFTDFCGKFRIPLLQYLCSPKCTDSNPADSTSIEASTSNNEAISRLNQILLG